MKKSKQMSLRTRLTIITTLMLVCVCIVFTVFSITNLNYTLVVPIQTVLSSQSGAANEPGEEISTEKNGRLINAEMSLDEKDIRISAYTLTTEFGSKINKFMYISISFMILVIISGAFLMYSVSGSIIKPVRRLKEEIAHLKRDELSYRITDFEAGDELNQLADSFNSLLARLEQAFFRESRFISDAAHEIKTPLAVIKANLDVLSLDEKPEEEEYRECFKVVDKQINRLTLLIDDLLNMATAAEYQLNDRVYADELINEIIQETDKKIKEKEIHLTAKLSRVELSANSTMIKHAVLNIIDNAIKYNPQAGTIHIDVFSKEQKCIIQVIDSGPGIGEEHLEYIFQPFYRADKSRSGSTGSSGLGLAISHEIITRHGGKISCRKNDTKGCTFIIEIPVR